MSSRDLEKGEHIIDIVNIDHWGNDAYTMGLPPSAAFRIALWEKPYILDWFKKNYIHKIYPTAIIAYGRTHATQGSLTLTPSQTWVDKNLKHIALWHLFISRQFARELYTRFKDEIEEAATMWRTKQFEEETVKSYLEAQYGLYY